MGVMRSSIWRSGVPGVLGLLLATAVQAQAVSPRQLLEVADISHPVLSPDGNLVAFRMEQASVERNTYDTVWYVQRADGAGPARKVGEGGHLQRESDGASLVPAAAVWARDGRHLYYRALLHGRVDVWRAAADGSQAHAVTSDAADVRNFQLSADGRRLFYSVGATRDATEAATLGEYDAGIRIDQTIPIGQGLFRSGYLDERWTTQRLYGSDVIRAPLLSQLPERWKTVELASGQVSETAVNDIPVDPAAVDRQVADLHPWKQARDALTGNMALLTHVVAWDGVGPRPNVALSVLLDGQPSRRVDCHAALCTGKPITEVVWRPGRTAVLFTTTDPDDSQAQSIYEWDVATNRVTLIVKTNGLVNGGRAVPAPCAVSADAVVCVAADAGRPPRLERIDLNSRRRTVLFDPNAALAAEMANVPIERLRWTDAQGRTFNGLYYPAQRGTHPSALFITYYRCTGFVRGGVGDEWPLATLAGLGISALCINAPASDQDAITRFEIGRSCIERVVQVLAARGDIDRHRVGMGGLSYGTEMTYWMAMRSDVLAAASVSSIAFSPLAYTLMRMSGEAFVSRLRTYWQLGAPEETPEQWRRLSPVFNLERIHAPVLMQLPEQEYLHTLDYAGPLIRDGRADLYVYPNEAHQKFQPRHKLAVYTRNVDWFRFWLQDVEDPDPGKAAQYLAWRTMRATKAARPGAAAATP
ncbi:hypothetical protein XA1311A_06440 [Xanthomonas arboricola]|nr:hypothetical protein XA1311A_06440 [Xanthomonas arboricola]CAE6709707.1 hypothetical protein XA1311A_06440 [Xanthomonas arboricola]